MDTSVEAPFVLVTVERTVGYITLNRPQKRNALTRAMLEQMLEAVSRFERESAIRVVVVRSVGAAFCSGLDLADMQSVREQTGAFEFELVPELFARLGDLSKTTVAIIQGIAVAGGCELALHCDVRIGTPAARFAMPLAKLGLVIPAYAAERLVQTVGLTAARDMLLTGAAVDGLRAGQMGLLSRVVDATELESAAEQLVAGIAANAPLSLQAMKRVLNRLGPTLSADQHIAFDAERLRVSRSDDMREGLQAFFDRRAPFFRGM